MTRIGLVAAIAAALGGWVSAAGAATPIPFCYASAPCVFTTVDGIRTTGGGLYVTGILEGEATATEHYISLSTSSSSGIDPLASCQRLAMLAMAKPGQFVLRLATPVDAYSTATCQLTRVTP
jgi:hypothetical protein